MFLRTKLNAAFVLLTSLSGAAVACGPEFPYQMIPDRKAALAYLPEGTFYFEIQKLLPPTDVRIKAQPNDLPDDFFDQVEKQGLNDQQKAALDAMRQTEDVAAAYELGGDLPEAIRLYTAGAVIYKAAIKPRVAAIPEYESYPIKNPNYPLSDDQRKALVAAKKYFKAVTQLPPAAAQDRIVWATYMLGEIAIQEHNVKDANMYFEKTRTLVKKGAPDPLYLAVSSFGEQAYALRNPETAQFENVIAAATLYAEQTAHQTENPDKWLLIGSPQISLKHALKKIIKLPKEELQKAAQDKMLRNLLLAYVFSQGQWVAEEYGPALLSVMPVDTNDTYLLGRYAAVAYQAGQYDLAEKTAAKGGGALAAWINAKLALRKGDTEKAADYYAQAVRAFSTKEEWGATADAPEFYARDTFRPYCRVQAERGILHIAAKEYVDALSRLYQAPSYAIDALYLAERIVTTDELKQFVDAHVAQPSAEDLKNAVTPWGVDKQAYPAIAMREILARRLMRDGRYDEAVSYFEIDKNKTDAIAYRDAMNAANTSTNTNEKAEHFYQAAMLSRFSGMEIFGLEGPPDYALSGGSFEFGAFDDVEKSFASDDEKQRFEQSAPKYKMRFHYRARAVEEATQAAKLLPPRSQAFAAVLCNATHWIIHRVPEAGKQLYQWYLDEGAYVPWGDAFGTDRPCPEPDFAALKNFSYEKDTPIDIFWRQYVSKKRLALAAALLLTLFLYRKSQSLSAKQGIS